MGDETASPHPPLLHMTDAPRDLRHTGMSFLDLPAEIRNEIYEYLFPKGDSAVQLLARTSGNGGYIPMSDRLGLLATCRQIHKEASSVLRCPGRVKIRKPKTLVKMLFVCTSKIGARIFSFLTPTEGLRITYDLDKHYQSERVPAIMQASRSLRKKGIFYSRPRIEVRTTTSDGFRGLRKWAKNRLASLNLTVTKTRIIVCMDNSTSYFQAAQFLWATTGLVQFTIVEAYLSGGVVGTTRIMSLYQIWKKLLLFVDNMLEEYPQHKQARCPIIYINGCLEIFQADFTLNDGTVQSVSNSRQHWNNKEVFDYIRQQGQDILEKFRGVEEPEPSCEYGHSKAEGSDSDIDVNKEESLLGFGIRLVDLLYDPPSLVLPVYIGPTHHS